jgi:non-canonical (house-cleaning) NTP pyrophosphatase
MDGLAGMTDSRRGPGAVGILTNELVKRADAFMIGTAYALARFLHPEWYPD